MAVVIYKLRATRSMLKKYINGTCYTASEELSIDVLPTKRNVLECMIHILRPGNSGQQLKIHEASNLLARNLNRHWGFANIYTKGWRYVSKDIEKLYEKAKKNWRYSARDKKK